MQRGRFFEELFRDGVDNKTPCKPWAAGCTGGGKGSRTHDLLNAIQTLYQLSYTPINSGRADAAQRRAVHAGGGVIEVQCQPASTSPALLWPDSEKYLRQ